MASVKKEWGFVFALVFLWSISVPALADDSDLFDDPLFEAEGASQLAVDDPISGETVPVSPPAQPAPQGEALPDNLPPEPAVDLQPKEIPETMPVTSEQAAASPPAGPQPAAETPPDTAPQNPVPDTPPAAETVPSASPPRFPDEESRTASAEELPLVRFLLTPPDSVTSQLRGEPKSLADVLEGVTQPPQRQLVTERYWELAESLANYHLSLIHANDIEECITRFSKEGTLSENETAALVSARRRAAQQTAESKMTLAEAQCRLAEVLQASSPQANRNGLLAAIPTDIPNTLSYKTRYDQIKREKPLSPQAALLNEAIPARYEMMLLYDKTVSEALEAYRTLYYAGGTSAETLLSAADKLNDSKEMLIHCVTEYNKLIAAYVSETVGPEVRGSRLISTMIRPRPSESIPVWDAPEQTRIAVSPIPAEALPRRPRPAAAEIPASELDPFTPSSAPGPGRSLRPEQNAEIFR